MTTQSEPTFARVQRQLKPWQQHNFPDRPAWQPLLGMQEELGELSHAYLKKAQNIRGSAEEHDLAIKDAIGDIAVFACDYGNATNCEIGDGWHSKLPVLGTGYELLFRTGVSLGKLYNDHLAGIQTVFSLAEVLYNLNRFARTQDMDMEFIVAEVWDEVRLRNWRPEKGELPAEVQL